MKRDQEIQNMRNFDVEFIFHLDENGPNCGTDFQLVPASGGSVATDFRDAFTSVRQFMSKF